MENFEKNEENILSCNDILHVISMAKTNLKEQTCRVLKLICNGHDKHSSDGHGKKTQRTMAKNAFSCHGKKHIYKKF